MMKHLESRIHQDVEKRKSLSLLGCSSSFRTVTVLGIGVAHCVTTCN